VTGAVTGSRRASTFRRPAIAEIGDPQQETWMAQAKHDDILLQEQDAPELLVSFLQVVLDDVRSLSERSGRHLELAISTLAEDIKVIEITDAADGLRRLS
jgi:hypothetical protein